MCLYTVLVERRLQQLHQRSCQHVPPDITPVRRCQDHHLLAHTTGLVAITTYPSYQNVVSPLPCLLSWLSSIIHNISDTCDYTNGTQWFYEPHKLHLTLTFSALNYWRVLRVIQLIDCAYLYCNPELCTAWSVICTMLQSYLLLLEDCCRFKYCWPRRDT